MKKIIIETNSMAQVEQKISSFKKALKNAPDGEFDCQFRKGNYYWYQRTFSPRKKIYISRKQRRKAEQLALKKFNKYRLAYYSMLKIAISAFCQKFDFSISSPEEYLKSNPCIAELVSPFVSNLSKELKEWESEDYPKKQSYSENLKIKTLKGDFVRSKSECMIADNLYMKGIPYRYEWERYFDSGNYYPGCFLAPDFTIRHPKTGELIIWEHFGLMDNPEYAAQAAEKIRRYTDAGFIAGKNLIVTFETGNRALDSATIAEIIERFFSY